VIRFTIASLPVWNIMGQCRRLLINLIENIARQRRRQALAPATASGAQRDHFRPHAAQLVLQLPVAGAFLAQLLLHLAVPHHEVAVGSVLLVGLMAGLAIKNPPKKPKKNHQKMFFFVFFFFFF
jgi:hypothetical protein